MPTRAGGAGGHEVERAAHAAFILLMVGSAVNVGGLNGGGPFEDRWWDFWAGGVRVELKASEGRLQSRARNKSFQFHSHPVDTTFAVTPAQVLLFAVFVGEGPLNHHDWEYTFVVLDRSLSHFSDVSYDLMMYTYHFERIRSTLSRPIFTRDPSAAFSFGDLVTIFENWNGIYDVQDDAA